MGSEKREGEIASKRARKERKREREREREKAKRKRGTTSPEGPNIDLIHN